MNCLVYNFFENVDILKLKFEQVFYEKSKTYVLDIIYILSLSYIIGQFTLI
jgi:hypothetical protein